MLGSRSMLAKPASLPGSQSPQGSLLTFWSPLSLSVRSPQGGGAERTPSSGWPLRGGPGAVCGHSPPGQEWRRLEGCKSAMEAPRNSPLPRTPPPPGTRSAQPWSVTWVAHVPAPTPGHPQACPPKLPLTPSPPSLPSSRPPPPGPSDPTDAAVKFCF